MRIHEALVRQAQQRGDALALVAGARRWTYAELVADVQAFAQALAAAPALQRGERVAVWLDNRPETVTALWGTSLAGGVFVPINGVLKARQATYILQHCGVRRLVTSVARWRALHAVWQEEGAAPGAQVCPALVQVVLVPDQAGGAMPAPPSTDASALPVQVWSAWLGAHAAPTTVGEGTGPDGDVAAILYTSGSTGLPKGVVLSHRNLTAGAASVAGYLGLSASDRILAVLPLSFDAGLSQLTTAFTVGATAVLHNHLLPAHLLSLLVRERITVLTAVPPLYLQLCSVAWPAQAGDSVRLFANTGGRMPLATLQTLRARMPQAQPYLMYGLTEAFRSTFLPPDQVDRRPDSIGRAIPNAEVLVLREDGSECGVDEPGELVHRGPTVGLGYWADPVRTAERFRTLPQACAGRPAEVLLEERVVFSGDTVRRDAEGYLYFVGRRDEMIKTSGYRVSPVEVEEVLYATGLVGECAAFGVEDDALGQRIVVVATAPDGSAVLDTDALLEQCRQRMPAYMVPHAWQPLAGPLPRNPNGKIDRPRLAAQWQETSHD